MDNQSKISIITVCYNAITCIEKTILSVINQTYDNIEYIIIDGGSTDGTIDIIKKYENYISYWISEPDKGIYDAMNKGIKLSTGNWINLMNAGDVFTEENVLKKIFTNDIPVNTKIIYSDFFAQTKSEKLFFHTSIEKGRILHQSTIYKKSLHDEYGYYQVTKPIIISDFLFFCSIPTLYYYKTNIPISINEAYGISSQPWCYQQKICCDYIYNRITLNQLLFNLIVFRLKLVIKNILRYK